MNVDGRVEARIDAGAIAHNLACLRRLAGPARIWATAKADAYGHGLALALPGLREADGLAVLHLDAAWAAQAAGWDKPILVYGGLFDAAEAGRLDLPGLHLVISHAGQMDWLAQAARPARPPAVWLRYAGETRLGGFGDADYAAAYARCAALRAAGRIAGIGHLNHYARAEDADGVEAPHARFRSVIEGLPGPISTGNSAALLRHAHHAANTDWVRPGLALYGASPLPGVDGPGLGLRPAMTVSTRLYLVQTLEAGESLGYSAFAAPDRMRVGLAAIGYADGYPRHAGTGTPVLVEGRRTRLLGRASMDTLAVDLTGLPQARPGASVVLWGDGLPVEEVAAAAGTIAAELLTGLTARVPRRSPAPARTAETAA